MTNRETTRPQIVKGAVVHAMAAAGGPADAVAFDGGRISAVGPFAAVRARVGADADVLDVGEGAILPGFIDAHHHLMSISVFHQGVDCRPEATPSMDALVERFRAAANDLPAGEWLVGYGYDEWFLDRRRSPTREHLDAASRDRPVVLIHRSTSASRTRARWRRLAIAAPLRIRPEGSSSATGGGIRPGC
jgi:predicted amidohydrolase YtcJ